MQHHGLRSRAATIAISAVALGLTSACSTLQNLGTPTHGAGRAGLSRPIPRSGDPTRDRVEQVLQDRAPGLEHADRQRVVDAIFVAHNEHGFEPSLLLAVIAVESGFNPSARSSQGALGLMQVQPPTGQLMARELGIEWRGARTLFDPEANIRIGAAYLARMKEQFRDLEFSLAAYNVGPGRLQEIFDSGKRPAGIYAGKVRDEQQQIASTVGLHGGSISR